MKQRRRIVHIELPGAECSKAAQFYARLFGWKAEHTTAPVPYTALTTGSIGLGLPEHAAATPPRPVIYVESENIAADLKRIEKLGGTRLTDPFEVPGLGEMAFFTDPTGNRLALWHSYAPARTATPARSGSS